MSAVPARLNSAILFKTGNYKNLYFSLLFNTTIVIMDGPKDMVGGSPRAGGTFQPDRRRIEPC